MQNELKIIVNHVTSIFSPRKLHHIQYLGAALQDAVPLCGHWVVTEANKCVTIHVRFSQFCQCKMTISEFH